LIIITQTFLFFNTVKTAKTAFHFIIVEIISFENVRSDNLGKNEESDLLHNINVRGIFYLLQQL